MRTPADDVCSGETPDIEEELGAEVLMPYSPSYAVALRKLRSLTGLTSCNALPGRYVPVFKDVVGVRFLTKLSICGLRIRKIPPDIGCLKKLEELDVSFNKLKNLPDTLSGLTALKILSASNNKLVDLPAYISNLQRLNSLDLSSNRIASVCTLDFASLPALQHLNLQDNGHHIYSKHRICCRHLEGNRDDLIEDENCLEVELSDIDTHRVNVVNSCIGRVSSRLNLSQRASKMCNNHDSLQQKARQERLNYSRNCRGSGQIEIQNMHVIESKRFYMSCQLQYDISEKQADDSRKPCQPLGDQQGAPEDFSVQVDNAETIRFCSSANFTKNPNIGDGNSYCSSSSCVTSDVLEYELNKDGDIEDEAESCIVACPSTKNSSIIDVPSAKHLSTTYKSKRHSDSDLDNPKPRKCPRSIDESLCISFKYNSHSFCGIGDCLPDGFYDTGRHRPFFPLQNYDMGQFMDSREIILLDRRRDEELDGIVLSARLLLSRLKSFCDSPSPEQFSVNDFQRASVLALFVSDIFGGSERSSLLAKMRKAASGSNKLLPFVCTCPANNSHNNNEMYGTYNFNDLCERSLRLIKETHNSNIVPLGALRLGVCRHRSLLMKYICDRMDPPIPCELVRGYLDYMPHAWNTVLVQHGQSSIRMLVDTCYPTDIRREGDPEYFCRYIPLRRCLLPLSVDGPSFGSSFPSVSLEPETNGGSCRVVRRCTYGSLDAAVKVRKLEITNVPHEDIKIFEYSFLGEVRILGALKNHRSIVEIYGHRLSSKWVAPAKGFKEQHWLQSMIIMEYISGGSLKIYLDELSCNGAKHVPAELAICIARDVAFALIEVHSKQIIHRDIKSENILIDLECRRIDGSPMVKLSDFDRAVPLNSSLHSCCIAHVGIHPPDICVGTPSWMAPEVLQAMNRRSPYGLEADIWSYGCLLFELLTLEIPYNGLPDFEIFNLIRMGQRPRITSGLLDIAYTERSSSCGNYSSREKSMLKLLIELFYQCTLPNPADRPTAQQIYDSICDVVPVATI